LLILGLYERLELFDTDKGSLKVALDLVKSAEIVLKLVLLLGDLLDLFDQHGILLSHAICLSFELRELAFRR
jgi:hypothetical protein